MLAHKNILLLAFDSAFGVLPFLKGLGGSFSLPSSDSDVGSSCKVCDMCILETWDELDFFVLFRISYLVFIFIYPDGFWDRTVNLVK